MRKALTMAGCVLWIVGLVLFIIGMNIHTQTGQWLGIIGNILFFIGLGITGAVWLMKKKEDDRNNQR